MYTQRNVGYLQIGASVASTAATAGPIGDMNAGEVGVFTPEGVRMTEALAATEPRFIVVSKLADGSIVKSPTYNKADFASASVKAYEAGTVQLDYLGYNGVSGSIDAINSNLYKINIQVQELLRSNTDGRRVKFGIYESDASATQAEIAVGLAGSLIANFDREAEKFITFKALSNVALAADFAFDANFDMTVVNGSNIISSESATPAYNTGTALAVGDFIRLGTVGGGVALTDDVYEVIELPTTTTIKVDRKIQVASGVYADATGDATVITAALGAAADWGVALTGAALDFTTGKLNDEVAMWETQLVDFGTTTTNFKSTTAYRGSGTPNQLAQMEWFYQGNEGEFYKEGFAYLHSPKTNAVASPAGGGYDLINCTFNTVNTVGFSNEIAPQQLMIAVPTDASGATYAIAATANDITDVLEILAGTGIVASGGLAIT